jgi:ATP-binding cassette subfamily F protein 3
VRFTGNYDRYLTQRDAADAQQLAAYKTQQKEIAHLQAFVDRFKAKASKASQAQSKLKQIERMEQASRRRSATTRRSASASRSRSAAASG